MRESERPAGSTQTTPSAGRLVVLEGLDGAGTTTQARRLVDHLKHRGTPAHLTHQPSDGPAGRLLRQFLAGEHAVPGQAVDSATLALLFAADRVDHLQREVEPQIQGGQVVVSDRWYHSSLVYQGYATPEWRESSELVHQSWLSAAQVGHGPRDLLAPPVGWVRELNRLARRPDLTIILLVHPEVAARRRAAAGRAQELFDDLEVQRRVHAGYLQVVELARSWHEHVEVLDGEASVEEVSAQVAQIVESRIAQLRGAP